MKPLSFTFNRTKHLIVGLLLIAGCAFHSVAQKSAMVTINGVVIDGKTSTPLPGVNIMVKGSQTGTVSNIDGEYTLSAPSKSTLVFSFIGYLSYEVELSSEAMQTINVTLIESNKAIEEVVVIGYGTSLKKELTGSISTVKTKDFNKGAYNDAMGLIQGKVAGLYISKPSGADPQAGYSIILRGTNTLISGQGPLLIIDGVAGADLKNVNFDEVQSVDILKDGSAAAIYGTRGTNGVIIITTKRAKAGKTMIEYNSNFSVQVNPQGVQTLSASEFRYAINKYAPEKVGSIYNANTDWFNEVTRSLPFSQKHSIALSGGEESFSHRTTFNVEKNAGLLLSNESDKYLFKTNVNQKALDGNLDIDYNLTLGIRQYKPANYDIFYQAFIQNPTQPVYDPTNTEYGGYSRLTGIEYYNPVAMLKERDMNGKTTEYAPNVRASLNLFSGLKWVNFVAYEGSTWESNSYRTRYYPTRIGSDGVAEISNGSSYSMQYESTVNYSKSFNNHNIQAIAGYSYQEFENNDNYMGNSGFDSDIFGVNNIGVGSALKEGFAEMGSSKESNKLIAFFGRVMYNYNDKYLASASIRREGSTRFGTNHKWGNFPAVSLGWRLNKEDFLKNVDWINDLKLRLGYGVTGNQDFSNYQSLILFGFAGRFLYNGQWINTVQPISNPNPNLGWEKKYEFNAGIDFAMLNSRLNGALEYYYRTSTDLIFTYYVPSPPNIVESLTANVGQISNQGVELTLNAIPIKSSDFEWTATLTASKNINKLNKFSGSDIYTKYMDVGWIGGALPQYSQRMEEGKSLGNFYGLKWIGLDENGHDKFGNPNPVGFPMPTVIGNAYPFCSLGFSNTFTYKDWSLNMVLRSNIGGRVLNLYRAYYENWQTIGSRNIVHTQLENPEFTGSAIYSSKYVEDATFIKLDNVSISYKLNIKVKYVSAIRISFTAQNVFCLTKYKGLDPEVNLSGLEPGIERLSYYPRTTSLTLGINVTF